jgi:hypothetical protein
VIVSIDALLIVKAAELINKLYENYDAEDLEVVFNQKKKRIEIYEQETKRFVTMIDC